MDVFWTLPPVTRTITAAAVLLSAGLYSGLLSGYYYFFIPQFVFTVKMVPQIWRCFTAFLITHPKFGILMDPYLLYMYGSGLETESSRFSQPGDFFVYTGFLCSVIVVSLCFALCNMPVRSLARDHHHPRIICPPSLDSWLKRFLEPRNNTLARSAVPSFAKKQRGCRACGHGG